MEKEKLARKGGTGGTKKLCRLCMEKLLIIVTLERSNLRNSPLRSQNQFRNFSRRNSFKSFCVVEPPSLINHQASFLSIKPLVLRFRDFLPVTSHLRAARYRPKCGEKTFLCCFFRDVHWSEAKQQTPMNQECYVCCYSLCALHSSGSDLFLQSQPEKVYQKLGERCEKSNSTQTPSTIMKY